MFYASAYKPNSVPSLRKATAIYLGLPLLAASGDSPQQAAARSCTGVRILPFHLQSFLRSLPYKAFRLIRHFRSFVGSVSARTSHVAMDGGYPLPFPPSCEGSLCSDFPHIRINSMRGRPTEAFELYNSYSKKQIRLFSVVHLL